MTVDKPPRLSALGAEAQDAIDTALARAGYNRVELGHLVACQCACGGWITVHPDTTLNRFTAVRRHRETVQHRTWAEPLYGPVSVQAMWGLPDDDALHDLPLLPTLASRRRGRDT